MNKPLFKDSFPYFYQELDISKLPSHIDPETLPCNSTEVLWWKCENNHEWKQGVKNRTIRGGSYCQYCMGKKPYPGESDLATLYPHLVPEWDTEKNGDLSPVGFATHSRKKIWWICPKGHSYDMRVINRSAGEQNCPYCSGKRVLKGYNDVATTRPEILKFWDYEKNSMTPYEITDQSAKKVWFSCPIPGHSWQGTLVKLGRGKTIECKVCSGYEVISGINDLLSQAPEIAQELVDANPMTLYVYHSKKLTWKCDKGHIWKASPVQRTKYGEGKCPECFYNGRVGKPIGDIKDTNIAVKAPHIAAMWDYEKNGEMKPEEVSFGSMKKIWWKCDLGHSYQQEVNTKVYYNQGCPYCSNNRVFPGFNDLATHTPEAVKWWDYDNNGDLTPQTCAKNTSRVINWVCPDNEDHKFSKQVCSMVRTRPYCPQCMKWGTSVKEKELYKYVCSIYDGTVIENDRKLLGNKKEIDIYLPDTNLAIEFNGLYWHSEERIDDKNYHKEKYELCKDKGVQLLTIWEDDWDLRQDVVKHMIAHKLGVSSHDRVFARKTVVREISPSTTKEFLDAYHIQGYTSCVYRLGLFDGDELVAVSAWRKLDNTLYLDRYATSCQVVGGMGKMLKYGKQYALDHYCDEIVTFSDHCVSDGGLYDTLGFEIDKKLVPDYSYFDFDRRYHKFNYRKKRFKNDDSLFYHENMTEHQLAHMNGLYRIWDCGKTRWKMTV